MMKGWLFERSREDAKLLLSKLAFAVSLPLAAGYLALSPNQPSSSSSARAEPGAGGAAAVPVSAGGGRHLKDEIHIQESEEALAKIIHGDSSIASKDHPPSSKNLLDEEGFLLPPLKQLPLQRRESSLMRLTDDEFKVNKVEMEQDITRIQEKERSHLLHCYGTKNKQPLVREVEDQLKINLMKAKSLSLRIQSLNEGNQLVRNRDFEYSEMISELESVIMIINCLIRALKSDWWNSRQKMVATEQLITMLDNKNDSKGKEDANSKMMMELEDDHANLELKNSDSVERLEFENVAPSCCSPKGQEVEEELGANFSIEENEKEDYHCAEIKKMSHVWMINTCLKCDEAIESSTGEPTQSCASESSNAMIESKAEQKSLELADELEFEENMTSSGCIPNEEEVEEEFETNCSAEANEEGMEIKHQSDDKTAAILNMLNVWQINPCSECEQRTGSSTEEAAECCESEIWNDETQNSQQLVVEDADLTIDQKNRYHEDFDAGNTSLNRISNESTSCSSDTCSMTSNSSVVKSKHHGSRRKKILRKLQKMFLGKHHDHTKGKSSANKTPLSSACSDTMESVSTSCSDDARRNLLCDSDLPGFQKKHDSTKHFLRMKSSGDRWQSNTAWCQSFFRSPFAISPAKIFALQDEHTSALHEGNRRKPVCNKMVNRH